MKILLLGGRNFLGRSVVDNLVTSGHSVTLFNRAQTNPGLYPDLELIRGDRRYDFHLLQARKWDAIVDTSGYFPNDVEALAKALEACADHYVFISSCSVYDHSVQTAIADEAAPLVDLSVDTSDTSWQTYGARKYLCERSLDRFFNGRATHIRPGLIAGPFDSTYRFPYWGDRIRDGGTILAPGYPESPVQFIDARDLGQWITHVLENKVFGTYNAVGPKDALNIGRFLNEAIATINPAAVLSWVPEEFLIAQQVSCWMQLPLWVTRDSELFLKRDATRAIQNGLRFRPIQQTLEDTLAWSQNLDSDFKKTGLSREREQEVLAAWAKDQTTVGTV